MAERLQDLVSAQSRLLNDISHELRSPLARLSVALGLAWQRTGPEARSVLERIELEANRLNELIGRLLTLARLEGGEDAMRRTAISLEELVRDIAKDADFEAQSRHCSVGCMIQEDMIIFGSPSLLHSAVENVVRNATRHTRDSTEVEIRLARESGITERAVRLHGGTVRALNRPEGGLMVEIRLPIDFSRPPETPAKPSLATPVQTA